VIVCTYNRSGVLELCLEALSEQDAEKDMWEVIVVDNNSTDDTQKMCEKYLKKHSNYKIVLESEIGLSRARNRGFEEATGVYVAYIDDDAKARNNWISIMLDFIRRKPEAVAFGGPDYGYVLSGRPEWLPVEYMQIELDPGRGLERIIHLPDEIYTGCNMVFRKDILKAFGGFNVQLGMSGTEIGYGEETNLLLTIQRAGYPVYYLHDLKVDHLILEYKLSLKWNLRSFYKIGRTYDKTMNRSFGLLIRLFRLSGAMAVGLMQFMNPRIMPFKRRLYYSLRFPISEIGALITQLENLKK